MNKLILVGVWGCGVVACGSDPRVYASPIGGDGGVSTVETAASTLPSALSGLDAGAGDGPTKGQSTAETASKNDSERFSTIGTTGDGGSGVGSSASGPGESTLPTPTSDVETTTAAPSSGPQETSASTSEAPTSTSETPTSGEETTVPTGEGVLLEASPMDGAPPAGWVVGGLGGVDTSNATLERADGVLFAHTDVLEDSLRTFTFRLSAAQTSKVYKYTGVGFWICGAGEYLAWVSILNPSTFAVGAHTVALDAPSEWTAVRVGWDELTPYTDFDQRETGFSLESLYSVGFGATSAVELRIANFQFIQGDSPLLGEAPEGSCPQ